MSPATLHRASLRIVSVLVPETQRADWLAEWRSELWHVRRDPREMNVAAFCLGAFRDAFWLWRNGPNLESHGILRLDAPATPEGIESFPDQGVAALSSPVRCLAFLAALGALCAAVALLLPAARTVLLSALYPGDLIMLSPAVDGDPGVANGFLDPYPSVSREQFESLRAHGDRQFTGLAFYVPARLPVETPNGKRMLSVARTTADLFRVVGQRRNLPGSGDAWLIEDETALAALPASREGFVVGRLRYGDLLNSQFHFIRLRDGSLELFCVAPIALLFACILLRIMPSDSSGGHLRRTGPRRSLFLAAKALLVLPSLLFGSLDLASLGGSVSPLFFDIAVFGSLFAARWMLADQRKRCPVCLRLLANPVRIGESSRILLEWHGTELMCLRGHGLLYVPEWPAIWSGRQRWMGLGTSWVGLFPSGVVSRK